MIDIRARHGAREEVIVFAHVPAARRRPRTQLDVAGELERALAHMASLPEGEPLLALGRGGFRFSGDVEPAAVRRDPSVLLVHACSKYRSNP